MRLYRLPHAAGIDSLTLAEADVPQPGRGLTSLNQTSSPLTKSSTPKIFLQRVLGLNRHAQRFVAHHFAQGAPAGLRGRPPTGPFVVVIHAQIPWNLTNTKMPWSLDLLDPDGHPVSPGESQEPIHMEGFVESGRPAGMESGTAIYVPFVFPFFGMPLEPGKYEWHFKLADTEEIYSFFARS